MIGFKFASSSSSQQRCHIEIIMSLNAADLYNVKGLVALVTGGGSGLGLTMTQALIANGAAKVYIASRRIDSLKAAAASIGPNVIPIQCDATNKEDLERAAQKVKDDAGFLNLVVCNSGATGPGGNMFGSKDQTAEEFAEGEMCVEYDDYLKTFSINTTSVWFTAMAFLPLLNAGNKKGNVSQTSQVIIISSTSGLMKLGGAGWAYGQSKAASIHLTKQLSTLLPKWKMRANCITPGCKSAAEMLRKREKYLEIFS
ncbi:hypothetical protein Golomagni_07906 [Golovinomyces magnicellulatus]|nr:hypothetical protein Golomagni_07906 [Golovinomyces magnicellulatus]